MKIDICYIPKARNHGTHIQINDIVEEFKFEMRTRKLNDIKDRIWFSQHFQLTKLKLQSVQIWGFLSISFLSVGLQINESVHAKT